MQEKKMIASIPTIDPATVKQWLDQHEAVIIDVREPEEYAALHIAGATLIPLGTLHPHTLPRFNNKKLIIHCQAGKRSSMACEKLLTVDPIMPVFSLAGGILAWKEAGFPTESSAS